MKILLVVALLCFGITSQASEDTALNEGVSQSRTSVLSIGTEELAELIIDEPDMLLVDVRTSNEVAAMGGSIKAEQNINIPMSWLTIKEISADKNRPIVLYCGEGLRSPLAAKTLKGLGYTHVMSYSSGFIGWKNAGMPIE